MLDNEYPAKMEALIEKLEDRHTPPSMQYALLDEMARLVDAGGQNGTDPIDALEFYLYIGGSYHALGHYIFALTAYNKAVALLPKCGDSVSDDEDFAEELYEGFTNMLDMYRKMKTPQAEEKILDLIKEIMPDSFEAIKNSKSSHLKIDPVEYTERYMAILPELEAKLETELGTAAGRRGRGRLRAQKKVEILRSDYGIKWKSLYELNPRVRFD